MVSVFDQTTGPCSLVQLTHQCPIPLPTHTSTRLIHAMSHLMSHVKPQSLEEDFSNPVLHGHFSSSTLELSFLACPTASG